MKQAPTEKMAVLLLDIDRFKVINETLGYSLGDKLLMALTKELTAVLPSTILMARFYGEQFTLLVTGLDNEEQLEDICLLIQEALKKPIQVENINLRVFVSIGIAVYPKHGSNVDELFQNANSAMYKAKQTDKKFKLYDSSMNEELLEQLVLENDLHQALKNQEFRLVYQPQINVETNKIFSLESLIRWEHPTRGLIPPTKFVPIAEKTGLIVPMGEWILGTACQQLKQWHEQGLDHLGIAVNLSARQFYQDNLVEMIASILEEFQLKPTYLELEITESMTMMNMGHSLEILQQLKDLGVRIAIDDFGTGYSSLNYLNNLPFDRLKIDRSFFRDVLATNQNTTTIVSLIISKARHLNMDVIAEGVENLEQVKFLIEKNCTKMQGYLFSKPLEPSKLVEEIDTLQEKISSKSIFVTS